MPPQAPGAQFTDDGPPDFVRLLSAAVAKQRRAAARDTARAEKAEQQRQAAAALGGRVLVLRDDGASSDGSSEASGDEFELTEAEAAALGWEVTAEVLENMHKTSDATVQRAEIAKQNRRVRRTLAQVQRRVERTVKDFRRRTAELRAEVDSDEEDILGSILREQGGGGSGGVGEGKGGREVQGATRGDTVESFDSAEARGEKRLTAAQRAASSASMAPNETAGSLSSTAGNAAKRRAAAQRKASAARGARLMGAKIGGATPALRRRSSGRRRRGRAAAPGGDSGSSGGDSQEEAAILDRMFGVGDNVDGDIAVMRRRLRSQLEATATGNERESDRRRWITRRARRDIQELLQLRAARSAAQSHTLGAVLGELRQYHSVDQRQAPEPAPVASLAATDVMLQQVEADIASAQDTLWQDTRSLGGVFEASKGLFARLLEQAASGAKSAKLKGEIKTLQVALGKHGDTIEKLLSKLHMTESRLQRAQRSTAGKATHMEMLEKRVKEHDALVKTLRADISAKESAAATLRDTLAELREGSLTKEDAAALQEQLQDAQEQVRILEARNEQANARIDGMQEEALRLRMAANMAASGGAGGGALEDMQSAISWASSRVTPLQYQRALNDFSSLFYHLQWVVREALLVVRGSAREKAAHVVAPALARLRDSRWREDIEGSVGADAPAGSMGPGADVADRGDRLLVRGWFMEEGTAGVHSVMDLLTLLSGMTPDGPVPDVPDTPRGSSSPKHGRSGYPSRSLGSPVRAGSRSSGGGSEGVGGGSPRVSLSLSSARSSPVSPKHRAGSVASTGGSPQGMSGGGFPPRAPPLVDTSLSEHSTPAASSINGGPASTSHNAPLTPPLEGGAPVALSAGSPGEASAKQVPRAIKPRARAKGGRRGSVKSNKGRSKGSTTNGQASTAAGDASSPPPKRSPQKSSSPPKQAVPAAPKRNSVQAQDRSASPPSTVAEVDAPTGDGHRDAGFSRGQGGTRGGAASPQRPPIRTRSTAEDRGSRALLVATSDSEGGGESPDEGASTSMKVVGRTVDQGHGGSPSPPGAPPGRRAPPTVLSRDSSTLSSRGSGSSPLYTSQAQLGERTMSTASTGSLHFTQGAAGRGSSPPLGRGGIAGGGTAASGQRRHVSISEGKGGDSASEGGASPRAMPPKSPPPRGAQWGDKGGVPSTQGSLSPRRRASLDPMAVDLDKLGVTFGGDTTVVVVQALQRRVRAADDTIATLQGQVHALRKKLAAREGGEGGLSGIVGTPLLLGSRQGSASDGALRTGGGYLSAPVLTSSQSTPLQLTAPPPTQPLVMQQASGRPQESRSQPELTQARSAQQPSTGDTGLHPALERLASAVGTVHAAAVVVAGAGASVGDAAAPSAGATPPGDDTSEGNLYKLGSARLQMQGSLAEVQAVLQAVAAEAHGLRTQLGQARDELEHVRSTHKQEQRMTVHRTERDVAFALQEQLVSHVRKLEAQFQASLAKAVRRLVASRRPSHMDSSASRGSLQAASPSTQQVDAGVEPRAGSFTSSVNPVKGGSKRQSQARKQPMLHPTAQLESPQKDPPSHSAAQGLEARDSSPHDDTLQGTARSVGDIDPSAPPSASQRPSFGAFVARRREAYSVAAGVEDGEAPMGPPPPAEAAHPGGLHARGRGAALSPREGLMANPSLFAHYRGKPKLRRGVHGGEGGVSTSMPSSSAAARAIVPVAPQQPKPIRVRPTDLSRAAAAAPGSTSHSDPFASSSHFQDTAVQRRALAALPKNRRPAEVEPRAPTDAMMGGGAASPSPVSPPPSSRGRGSLTRSPAAEGVVAPPRLRGPVPGHGADASSAAVAAVSWAPPRQSGVAQGRAGAASDGPATPSSTFEMTFSRGGSGGARPGVSWARRRGAAHEGGGGGGVAGGGGGYASDGGGLSTTLAAKTRLIHALVLAGSSEYGIYRHLKAKYEGDEEEESEEDQGREAVVAAPVPPRPLLLSPAARASPPPAQLEGGGTDSAVSKLPAPPAGRDRGGHAAGRGPLAVRINTQPPAAETPPPAAAAPPLHAFEAAVLALQAVPAGQIPSLVAAAGRGVLVDGAAAPSTAGALTTAVKARPRAPSPLRSSTPGGGVARSDTADSRGSGRSRTPLYAAGPSDSDLESGTAAGRRRRGVRHATMHTLWLLLQWHGARVRLVAAARSRERWAWMRRQLVLARQCAAIEAELTAAEARQRDLEGSDPGGDLAACKRSAAALRLAAARAARLGASYREVHAAREALLQAQLSAAEAAAMGVLSRVAGGDGSDAPPLPLLDSRGGGALASPFLAPMGAQRTVTPVPKTSMEHPFVQNMPLAPRHSGASAGGVGRPRTAPVGEEMPATGRMQHSDALLERSDITAVLDAMPPVLATPTGGSATAGAEHTGAHTGGVLRKHANSAWQLLATHLQRTAVDAVSGMGVHAEDGRLPALGVALADQDRYSMALEQEHTSPVLLSLAVPALPASLGGVSLLSDTVQSRSLLPRAVVNRMVAALPFLPLGTPEWAGMPLWGQARVMLDVMEFALLGAPPRVVAATTADKLSVPERGPGGSSHIIPAARLRDPWSNVDFRVFGQASRPGAGVAESAAALEGGCLWGTRGRPHTKTK